MDRLKKLSIPNPGELRSYGPYVNGTVSEDITITGGSFTPSTITFSNISPNTGSGGVFAVTAVISGMVQFGDWYEQDLIVIPPSGPTTAPHIYQSSFHSPDFVITFQSITLSITAAITLGDKNELQLQLTNPNVTDQSFTYHLPQPSFLRDDITDQIKKTVSNDVSSMTAGIGNITIIPNSRKLTDHITFHFPGSQLQFPSDNNGAQYRVLGQVTFDSQNAPGDIGTIPFPPIPTDHDATFFANNYEFNALFWAFYQEGDLHTSFNQENATFKAAFNTGYYPGTPLAEAYPDRNLIIDLVLTQAPTVNLTEGVADISYPADLTYWIAKEGSETEKDVEAFKMSVTDLDGLEGFAVSSNPQMLQLITFMVTSIKELSYELISTNIPGLDAKTFEPMWKDTLHPAYVEILNKAAQVGVPLPSSLQGIFTDYKIDLHVGYTSASVNFTSAKRYR